MSTENVHDLFDTDEYLRTRVGDMSPDRVRYPLEKFHKFFSALPQTEDMKVLDFGSGPIIQHCISAAANASQIVFSDIAAPNRESIQKWLRNDVDSFNWSPQFNYVVKTLEGKGDKKAREREMRMREIAKVAYCNALLDRPMEEGFEGPYDVLIECGCLDTAASDRQSFVNCAKKLMSLLKPGGIYLRYPFEFFLIDWRNVLWLGLRKSSGQKSVSMFSNPLSFSAEMTNSQVQRLQACLYLPTLYTSPSVSATAFSEYTFISAKTPNRL